MKRDAVSPKPLPTNLGVAIRVHGSPAVVLIVPRLALRPGPVAQMRPLDKLNLEAGEHRSNGDEDLLLCKIPSGTGSSAATCEDE
jgi:hypothetical protein